MVDELRDERAGAIDAAAHGAEGTSSSAYIARNCCATTSVKMTQISLMRLARDAGPDDATPTKDPPAHQAKGRVPTTRGPHGSAALADVAALAQLLLHERLVHRVEVRAGGG